MNAWLSAQRVRVLIPLVWLLSFSGALFGSLTVFAIGAAHHVYWRQIIFGSCVVMLGTVTGIKARQR